MAKNRIAPRNQYGIPVMGVLGRDIPGPGVSGSDGPALAYDSLDLPADNDKRYRVEVVTPPPSGLLTINPDTSATFDRQGGADGDYVATLRLIEDEINRGNFTSTFRYGTPAIPVSFSGFIPDTSVTIGNNVNIDVRPFFSGSETPITYAINVGTLPESVTLTNGIISGTTTEVINAIEIQVRATDDAGNTADSNLFDIRVAAAPNIPPIANAGNDSTITVNSLVTLNGTRSSDPDGDPITYEWSFESTPIGASVVLNDPTLERPSFRPNVTGEYVLRLVVNDGTVDSSPSFVTITVQAVIAVPPVTDDGDVIVNRVLSLLVMDELTVGDRSNLGRAKARVLDTRHELLSINGIVLTLDDVSDIAIGATAIGATSASEISVNNVDYDNNQLTVTINSGVLIQNETLVFRTPYISRENDDVITVGGAKSDPTILGQIGQDFASGLNSKVDWRFFQYDGSVEYGAGVQVGTRDTVILYTVGLNTTYYRLNLSAAVPYTLNGDIAVDLPNFELLNGADGIRGDRGLQGPAGIGQQYSWRTLVPTAPSDEFAVVSQDGIYADTRTAVISLTLPQNPEVDQIFAIADLHGTWDLNNVTLLRNGNKIMNLEENMILSRRYANYEFVYTGADFGWRILT